MIKPLQKGDSRWMRLTRIPQRLSHPARMPNQWGETVGAFRNGLKTDSCRQGLAKRCVEESYKSFLTKRFIVRN